VLIFVAFAIDGLPLIDGPGARLGTVPAFGAITPGPINKIIPIKNLNKKYLKKN
jgi:hypothetical protein